LGDQNIIDEITYELNPIKGNPKQRILGIVRDALHSVAVLYLSYARNKPNARKQTRINPMSSFLVYAIIDPASK
jgi:hypothetical protein